MFFVDLIRTGKTQVRVKQPRSATLLTTYILLRQSPRCPPRFPLPGQNGDADVQNYEGGPDVDENKDDRGNALNSLHHLDVLAHLLDPLLDGFTPLLDPHLEVFKLLLDPLQEVFTLQLQPSAEFAAGIRTLHAIAFRSYVTKYVKMIGPSLNSIYLLYC